MEIIGLLGHQGVGKNYIAEKILPFILEEKPTIVLAFADHFKIDCICKHGIEYDKVFGKKDYKTRKILQRVGTEEVDNLKFAQMISDAVGKPLNYEMVDFHTSRPGHDLRYALSGDLLKQLGWEPRIKLSERIKETVDWTLANDRWLRNS